jgi:putative (di)nucleoside polyphosphate hydrolase
MANRNDGYFRASAGAIVIDGQKRLLALRRKGTAEEAWQMPQGGIGKDETPEHAVWRELQEETGLTAADLELLEASREWMVYELPAALRSPKVGWGQAQRWFLFRARPGAKVRPDGKEFDAFAWITQTELLSRVVEFRRPVYVRVFSEFAIWLEL